MRKEIVLLLALLASVDRALAQETWLRCQDSSYTFTLQLDQASGRVSEYYPNDKVRYSVPATFSERTIQRSLTIDVKADQLCAETVSLGRYSGTLSRSGGTRCCCDVISASPRNFRCSTMETPSRRF